MTDPSAPDPSIQPTAPTPPPPPDDLSPEDDSDAVDESLDELALLGESSAPPPWVGMVTGAGAALALVTALDVIGVIAQGVAMPTEQLSLLYRVGYAFLQNLNRGGLGGLALLLTLLLVCLPTIAGRTTSDRHDRAAALTIGVATAFAVILMIGTILAVGSQLKVLDIQGQTMDSRLQRELASFVVRHVGTAAIALVTGLAALRVRFAPPAAALVETEVPLPPSPLG